MVPAVVTDRLPEPQVAATRQITLQLVQLQVECNSCTCDKYFYRNKKHTIQRFTNSQAERETGLQIQTSTQNNEIMSVNQRVMFSLQLAEHVLILRL